MKSDISDSVLKCKTCGKEFKYESDKRRHEQSHVPGFECKVCLKKFSFASALQRHEKQHERKEKALCKKCGRQFRDETLLKRHKEYAHRGTHKCKKCSATLHSELALRKHMKTHKPESERKFCCSYGGCGKTFNFSHHLKHHELTHTDDKPHVCMECGKRFIQLHQLKIHQRVHEPASWLPCPELHCYKKFTNEYALRRHIATHKDAAGAAKKARSGKSKKKVTLDETKTAQKDSKNIKREIEELCISTPLEIDPEGEMNTAVESSSVIVEFIEIVDIKPLNVKYGVLDDRATLDKYEELGKNIDDENVELDDIQLSTSNCTSIIGKCLVTGDAEPNESCLCAQISTKTTSSKNYETISPNIGSPSVLMDNMKCMEKILNDVNACESCECASICGIRNKSTENVEYENPKFEKRNDNIVKIKDTFDIDFDNIENYETGILQNNYDLNSKADVFNSCKDILGKCIVSGDGTIGEGCLCAKMSANNQQIIAQEIEEITPCPKSH